MDLPPEGTMARRQYDLIAESEDGLTDYEVEDLTGRSHQSVSGMRKTMLVDKGLVRKSGRKRLNQYDNLVNIYVATEN